MTRPRAPKTTIAHDLRCQQGTEVALEVAWIDEYLAKQAAEEESARRKKQEEVDAEEARLLNFKEHELNGGLLEWYQFFSWPVGTDFQWLLF